LFTKTIPVIRSSRPLGGRQINQTLQPILGTKPDTGDPEATSVREVVLGNRQSEDSRRTLRNKCHWLFVRKRDRRGFDPPDAPVIPSEMFREIE